MNYLTLFVKPILLITIALLLGGCNTLQNKTEVEAEPQVDLQEIKRKANQAYENDDLQNGEKYYEILIKELPQEAEYWFRMANIYVRTERPYASMNLYREAVIRDPKHSKAWYNLSVVQLKQTAFSLSEMLVYADKQDPLYGKAYDMLEEIKKIIQEK